MTCPLCGGGCWCTRCEGFPIGEDDDGEYIWCDECNGTGDCVRCDGRGTCDE